MLSSQPETQATMNCSSLVDKDYNCDMHSRRFVALCKIAVAAVCTTRRLESVEVEPGRRSPQVTDLKCANRESCADSGSSCEGQVRRHVSDVLCSFGDV